MTSKQMQILETNAEYNGISKLIMMENAGHNIAREITSRFTKDKEIAIFCGLGGKGGDGFVVARHLVASGFQVSLVLAGKPEQIMHKEALQNWFALQPFIPPIQLYKVPDSSSIPTLIADVVVDALLGTGAQGQLRPPIKQLVNKMNSMNAYRVAVDMPTGIDSETGRIYGETVKADLTVTFHRAKKVLAGAQKYTGELVVTRIGLPLELENRVGPGDVLSIIRARSSESHKGDSGRLLVIGGNETYSGAPTFVALSALRTGVDLAIVAAPANTAHDISSLSPDLITIKLEGNHLHPRNIPTLKKHIEKADAVVVGPGLGINDDTKTAVKRIVDLVQKARKPFLLDADGLKAFADFRKKLSVPTVFTPHAGEYAILAGRKSTENIKAEEVRKTAEELNSVVLLKGAVDVISDGYEIKFNYTGNAGMTVGGTGDVLSGIVGGFLAQKIDPFEAAVAGAFVNGAAGDFAVGQLGYHIIASDLLDWIPHVLNDPMSHITVRSKNAQQTCS